jgi:pantoate--beta-alanine ligase
MNILKTAQYVTQDSHYQKINGKSIGFIPSMGALHPGHISLAKQSIDQGLYTIFSIFINPKQFNDAKDLELYPRTLEKDLELLYNIGVDAVYCPDTNDVFGPNYMDEPIDLGNIESIIEGAQRHGHFIGVARVVKRLFEIVQPDNAFFGQKDFQQTAIIHKLVQLYNFPIQLHICPTVREQNGLAMSSRNERLTPHARKQAGFIYQTLCTLKNDLKLMPISVAKEKAMATLNSHQGAFTEYLEIVDGESLMQIEYLEKSKKPIALAVVRLENVRLLDNILL